jgi:hypothetical protein
VLFRFLYDLYRYRIAPEITFAKARTELSEKLQKAALKKAAVVAKKAPSLIRSGIENIAWPNAVNLATRTWESGKTAAKVFYHWGMGGEGLFKVIENPHILAAERMGASKETLERLGLAFRKEDEPLKDFLKRREASREMLVLNPTLRKRLVYGGMAVGAIGALGAMNGPGGHDRRVPVYSNSSNDMGADGDLALSMYYNNR